MMFQEMMIAMEMEGKLPLAGSFFFLTALSLRCCLWALSSTRSSHFSGFSSSTGLQGGWGLWWSWCWASLPSNGILPSHHHLLWNSCPLDYQGNLRWDYFEVSLLYFAPWHCSEDLPIFLIIYSDSNPISFSQVTVLQCWHFRKQPLPPPLNLK